MLIEQTDSVRSEDIALIVQAIHNAARVGNLVVTITKTNSQGADTAASGSRGRVIRETVSAKVIMDIIQMNDIPRRKLAQLIGVEPPTISSILMGRTADISRQMKEKIVAAHKTGALQIPPEHMAMFKL